MENDKQKIMFVIPMQPFEGGIVKHSHNLLTAFKKAEYPTKTISWYKQYPKILYKKHPEINQRYPYILSYMNIFSWFKTKKMMKKYDRVIIPWVTPFHFFTYMYLLFNNKQKMVVHVHNVKPHENFPFTNFFTKTFFKRVNRIVCHSETIVKDLQTLGYQGEYHVVPHPPNIKLESNKTKSSNNILVYGYIRPYKGVDIAIEACGILKKQNIDFTLTIAGSLWDPSLEEELLSSINKHKLDDVTETVFEYVSDEKTAELFNNASVLCASYRSASQSGIVPLAFASGTVPVVTNVGGLPENIVQGFNGFIAEESTANSVAEALRLALQNQETISVNSAASTTTWNDIINHYL